MLISLVFSFRNEEKNIPELITRVRKTLDSLNLEYELIFVNDCSDDASLHLLLQHHENDKRIKIINMSRRFGPSPCLMGGLRHAQGDAVVYMDSDLQDPPEIIPQMIEKWQNGADIVHTVRTKRNGENIFRIWVTKLGYAFIDMLSDVPIPRNAGDFKLLSRKALNEVTKLQEYDPYMRGIVSWVGFKQEHIYYERAARFSGKTHFPLLGLPDSMKHFFKGTTSFSVLPLWFALVLGFIISLGAFLYLIGIIITTLFLGMHLPGWPALMVTLLFLGGTILFTIGIVGLYIGRIYQDVKARPLYIVENKIGISELDLTT